MATVQEPMVSNLGGDGYELDVKQLLTALTALKKGDFSVRLPVEWTGVAGKVADAFNEVTDLNERMAHELDRLSLVVGKEGKISQRASLGHVSGSWAESINSVNALIGDLVHPISETARVIGAVAKGDLSQNMAMEIDDRPLEGEFLRTAKIVNKMVDQLGSFASEVTRVAREVGTEGKLGGQAKVKGEFLELKDTINTMVDQLRSFASEVTRVAREVGTEGKLGGQARVEGVSG